MAEQRHRTDCNIESTYELWTDIDPKRTYLSFGGSAAATSTSADGVRAIGVDEKGETEFDFVVPALAQPGTTKPLLRLSQGLAVLIGLPNQSFSFQTRGLPEMAPGRLAVLVGTTSELQPFIAVPAAAQLAPLATFITDPHSGAPILLVTGPSWQAVASAIESLVSSTDRSVGVQRDVLVTQRWQTGCAGYSMPIFLCRTWASRRRNFQDAVSAPISASRAADFYAMYGEATILLTQPMPQRCCGSHIDVYVNGGVALDGPDQQFWRRRLSPSADRVTMRHFRPGLNGRGQASL